MMREHRARKNAMMAVSSMVFPFPSREVGELLEEVGEDPVMGCDVGYDDDYCDDHQGDYSEEEFVFCFHCLWFVLVDPPTRLQLYIPMYLRTCPVLKKTDRRKIR